MKAFCLLVGASAIFFGYLKFPPDHITTVWNNLSDAFMIAAGAAFLAISAGK